MNKIIKIIELLEIVASKQKIPKKIMYEHEEYVFDGKSYVCCDHDATSLLSEYNTYRFIDFLNDEVEILEDNTEEIEELSTYREIDKFDELAKKCINVNAELFYYKINELVKAVNSIRKDKNND